VDWNLEAMNPDPLPGYVWFETAGKVFQVDERRKRPLMGLVPATTTVLSHVFSIEERGRNLFEAAGRLDLEGIVAKRNADPYRPETV
jgi:hypothetical protein